MPGPTPEFSRILLIDRLGEGELVEEIAATADERTALADRFGLVGLDRLDAQLRIGRWGNEGLFRVTGRLRADVTQACVVSLEPVRSHLDETFSQVYTTGRFEPAGGEVVVDPEDEDVPEPIGPRGLDLGEAVAQQLALALDPYPRAPEASLPEEATGEADETSAGKSPFAVLKSLKGGS